jgi:septal ring factor EnvC (AmiA/AmiB activator)
MLKIVADFATTQRRNRLMRARTLTGLLIFTGIVAIPVSARADTGPSDGTEAEIAALRQAVTDLQADHAVLKTQVAALQLEVGDLEVRVNKLESPPPPSPQCGGDPFCDIRGGNLGDNYNPASPPQTP